MVGKVLKKINIDQLPTDQSIPSHDEINIIKTIFNDKNNMNKLFSGLKKIIIAGLLFAILSLPPIDPLIHKIMPSIAKSPYTTIIIKTVIFIVLYFVICNLYLARANK